MKPGEFVGADGLVRQAHLHYSVECGKGWWFPSPSQLTPEDEDFPAAVAALQALIKPSLDPEQCCNCRFWWHQSEGGRFINGWCRRHPPAPAFPGSLPDDWCGEYERRRG